MPSTPVIAILDVGKTNKKIFLFDEMYRIVWESSAFLPEIKDEDGYACEDLNSLHEWIREVLMRAGEAGDFDIRAINFSAYGASLVHIGEQGPITPLYNYLKPYPEKIRKDFYKQYGGELTFSILTASPVLGSLNSGMQLYRLKREKPEIFSRIKYSLHLPQYLSWLLTDKPCSDMTSIGCHTNLWNFSQDYYHEWVYRENIIEKLAPIQSERLVFPVNHSCRFPELKHLSASCVAGIGLHDSSAAMIPYLESFQEPFILLSTGTWCISMNPFNQQPLTIAELQNDCLCYLSFRGKPIKASRLFAGYDHELQVERLSKYFQREKNECLDFKFSPETVARLEFRDEIKTSRPASVMVNASRFSERDLSVYENFEEAYHQLIMDIIAQQLVSTQWIISDDSVKRIFVDGGFSKNEIYMYLLASVFPKMEVFAASIAQASAIGAAMAIHEHWNSRSLPSDIIELKKYVSIRV